MERLFIVFAATFLRHGDCQAKIKLIAGGKKDDSDPEVQIISVKNDLCGFSNTFSSPNLISEAFLFVNYLSVSFLYHIICTIVTSKIQLWGFLFKEYLGRGVSHHPSLSKMKHNHYGNHIYQKGFLFGCFSFS